MQSLYGAIANTKIKKYNGDKYRHGIPKSFSDS